MMLKPHRLFAARAEASRIYAGTLIVDETPLHEQPIPEEMPTPPPPNPPAQ